MASACPYGICDGDGMVVDVAANTTYRCRCWPEQVARRRAKNLAHTVRPKFRNLSFDREPLPSIARTAPDQVRAVRRYCERIDEMIDRGEGMWFLGGPGTGKSHLAHLISQHALAARRSVAIYTGPDLLNALRRAIGDEHGGTFALIEQLTTVEFLLVDDLAVARPTDWVLEQLYTLINGRYENERSIVFTCDLTGDEDEGKIEPDKLADHITRRNFSRLMEMCGDPIVLAGPDNRRERVRRPAYDEVG